MLWGLLTSWLIRLLDYLFFHIDLAKTEGALICLISSGRCRSVWLSLGNVVFSRVRFKVTLCRVRRESIVGEHGCVAMNLIFSIFWRNAILDVELLLLGAEIVGLRSKSKVLWTIEVELLLARIFHCEIISTYLNLIKLIWIN